MNTEYTQWINKFQWKEKSKYKNYELTNSKEISKTLISPQDSNKWKNIDIESSFPNRNIPNTWRCIDITIT